MVTSIKPIGDRALVVEFDNEISEKVNMEVMGMEQKIRECAGVVECVPTYRSLLVYFDPQRLSYSQEKDLILSIRMEEHLDEAGKKKILQVPCAYGGSYGEDLAELSRELSLSEQEIIRLHSERIYRIYMMGFLPGFVYLGGLNEKIWAPRLQTPRIAIPKGGVGIGGKQTGVYPVESPGGWRLIGRTPIDFYDAQRKEPILCRAGEYIQFIPITGREFEKIEKDVGAGTWKKEYIME